MLFTYNSNCLGTHQPTVMNDINTNSSNVTDQLLPHPWSRTKISPFVTSGNLWACLISAREWVYALLLLWNSSKGRWKKTSRSKMESLLLSPTETSWLTTLKFQPPRSGIWSQSAWDFHTSISEVICFRKNSCFPPKGKRPRLKQSTFNFFVSPSSCL